MTGAGQLQLGEEPPEPWVPPPTTRWVLVTEPGTAYLLTESGDLDDVPGPIPPPRELDVELGPGIGTSTSWAGGIAGFVDYLILECDRNRLHAAAARSRRRS